MKIKTLVENSENYREKLIIRFNFLGIVMNVFLSAFKIINGLAIRSTAMILDGTEGISDILSSTITIIMIRLSLRKPDRKHPLGYGRIEYVSTLAIIMFIAVMGIRAIFEIIESIINPISEDNIGLFPIIIMIVSVICKYIYGTKTRKAGKKINSVGLMTMGADTSRDAYTGLGILFALIIRKYSGFNIEPYISMAITLSIFKTVYTSITDTMNHLLGTSSDSEYVRKIKKLLIDVDGVENVFNLVIHDYGENQKVGSLNIEVDKNLTADKITVLSHRIKRIASDNGLLITSVGISGSDYDDERVVKMWDNILNKIKNHKDIDRAYGFSVDFKDKVIFFYILPDPSSDEEKTITDLKKEINQDYPDMRIKIEILLED